ncbi:hypothetical protein AKJ53_00325 [candidate division MSBL1 archaeon SCGC-AAA382F02]|uniref:Thiamine-monophosphate kinase n=1 Tax=candidate division MSBL1 archaeon SCGC-AAA382F02 TaxID=1698282 RepID=A0A133VIZ2_9EURY|nr:hypothetical protein AKJ53_00325 [candidate division MSBL1 archaeon SCGC-AAA382F02]
MNELVKLKDVGEKSLLKLARDICEEGPPVQVGVGDDGAAIKTEGESLVTTTDMLVEGIHFPSDVPIEKIGKKAVVVNLSDLAAMGAEPLGLVFSLGAPNEKEVEFLSDLLKGMNSTARSYDTYLVGGDLNEAEEVIIAGTAIGKVPEDEILLRSGAKPGDVIGLTGELGAAAAATEAILKDVSLKGEESLKKALFEPTARLEEGRILSESGEVTSAIDVTDGLASNLWQISRESEVELTVNFENIPISKAAKEFAEENELNLDTIALYGGEDFELLFTARPEAWDDLKTKIQDLGTEISKIGEVTSGEGVQIKRGNELEEMPDRGYEHFQE